MTILKTQYIELGDYMYSIVVVGVTFWDVIGIAKWSGDHFQPNFFIVSEDVVVVIRSQEKVIEDLTVKNCTYQVQGQITATLILCMLINFLLSNIFSSIMCSDF